MWCHVSGPLGSSFSVQMIKKKQVNMSVWCSHLVPWPFSHSTHSSSVHIIFYIKNKESWWGQVVLKSDATPSLPKRKMSYITWFHAVYVHLCICLTLINWLYVMLIFFYVWIFNLLINIYLSSIFIKYFINESNIWLINL